jgi:hypothetical protein
MSRSPSSSLHYCTRCWELNAQDEVRCVHCGAPLIGPEANSIPYVQKLLLALHRPEEEVRIRAAALLGEGEENKGDAEASRIASALGAALAQNVSAGDIPNARVQMAAARALGELGVCDASGGLCLLAQREEFALGVGLNAIDALATLADQGCAEAYDCLTRLAQQAGRQAIRREACSALALLNEPR